MSKIRIYELAKELGVDNKVVITRAIELGFQGKSSHSNSLDPDEADQIRRAVIRQAIGAPKNSEVVTRRLDRTTGATDTVVERRQGNVIRRRRTGEGSTDTLQSNEETEQVIDLPPTEIESVVEETTIEATQPEELVEESVELEAEEHLEPEIEEEVVAEEVEVEAPEKVVEQVAATPTVSSIAADPQKAIGPKILGKIELPQRRVTKVIDNSTSRRPVKTVGRDTSAALVIEETEDEEDSKKKKGNRKGKRREISSLDLADYGEIRRHKGGRHGHKDSDDRNASQQLENTRMKASKRVVKMDEMITVGELAKQMSLKAGEVIAKLLQMGMMATINQAVDKDTATILAEEFEYQVESTSFNETEILHEEVKDDESLLKPRPPVVTVMGHVDHGKTSLLDKIRSATVAAKEHGGITQHIGAYSVKTLSGRSITFIDTPGHAAFTAMRARGAQVTDIVVLVVAADDGVMPQTKEAINHAKAAGVPIIVAVNKMDKPGINPDRVKSQLAEHGLQPEEWGGDVLFYGVSALKGDGIPELLEGVLLVADVKEFKANPDRRARGAIIESRQERGRGVVATVLVQSGTLRVGEIFVTGSEYGRVRTMNDHDGKRIESAGPSIPVEVTGLSGMPEAGDDFFVVESEADARDVSSNRVVKKDQALKALSSGPISLEEFSKRAGTRPAEELNVILKADVQGSVEAVRQSIEKLSGEKVKVKVLHSAVGGVNESDIQLAVASGAVVIGFGVRAEARAAEDAERSGIEIRFYRVIYELLDDVKKAMVGLLEPIRQEVSLGRAEVRNVFSVSKVGAVAGCYVTGGVIKRTAHGRVLRDNVVIYEGKLASLRRFKDDAKEVQAGFECGIGIENFNDIKVGDVIEAFEFKEIADTLE